jgi:hypothetical protein
MGHSNDHGNFPHEAEQNEIGGPVTFAIFVLVVAIVVIYIMAK